MMLDPQGGQFPCHQSVNYDDLDAEEEDNIYRDSDNEVHCAGALAFAEIQNNATQMMRISERLGLYDPSKITEETKALVFHSFGEMLRVNREEQSRSRPRTL
jgi:hypothetical protein